MTLEAGVEHDIVGALMAGDELWIDGELVRLSAFADERSLPSVSASWLARSLQDDPFALATLRHLSSSGHARSDGELIEELCRDLAAGRRFLVRAPRTGGRSAPGSTAREQTAQAKEPEETRTWFELRVIDDRAEPVEGISVQFVIDGATLGATTDADGVARGDGRSGSTASASVASAAQARAKLGPRWAVPHVPAVLDAGVQSQYPKDPMPPVELRAETRRTIALVPCVLVVRLARSEVAGGQIVLSAGGEEVALPARRGRSRSNDRLEFRFAVGPGAAYTVVHELGESRRTVLSSSGLDASIAKATGTPWLAAALPSDAEMPPPPVPPPRRRGRTRVLGARSVVDERGVAVTRDPPPEGLGG